MLRLGALGSLPGRFPMLICVCFLLVVSLERTTFCCSESSMGKKNNVNYELSNKKQKPVSAHRGHCGCIAKFRMSPYLSFHQMFQIDNNHLTAKEQKQYCRECSDGMRKRLHRRYTAAATVIARRVGLRLCIACRRRS